MYSYLSDFRVRMENLAPFAFLFDKLRNARRYTEYDLLSLSLSLLLHVYEGMLFSGPNDIDAMGSFLQDLVQNMYGRRLTSDESRDLAYYLVLELLQNGGHTYQFSYRSPLHAEDETVNVNLLTVDDFKVGGRVRHKLTSQGLELLFMTKEVYKELRITIKQLYLKQQLEKHIFDGALRTVDDLSMLVRQLREEVREMVTRVKINALHVRFAEYEEIHARIHEQFKREQKEFESLALMVQSQRDSLQTDDRSHLTENDETALVKLHDVASRLDRVIAEHNHLFMDKLDLQRIYRDALKNQLAAGFRVRINFETELLDPLVRGNRPLAANVGIVAPLLQLRRRKSFNILRSVEAQLRRRELDEGPDEQISDEFDEESQQELKDKAQRRVENFQRYVKLVFASLNSKGTTSLQIMLSRLADEERDAVISSFDFYTFLILFHQAGEVDLEALLANESQVVNESGDEVSLEWVLLSVLQENTSWQEYKTLTFYSSDQSLKLANGVGVSDFHIRARRT